jgi:glycosyltransferase involved in cell wall biosynthesis
MEPEYLKKAGFDKVGLDNSKTIIQWGWDFTRLYYNWADVVTCPSKVTKADLIANGIHKPVKAISNGVNTILLKKVANREVDIKKKFDLPKKYFLYVGRVSIEKNIEEMIAAFKEFVKKSNDYDLVIVGNVAWDKELQEMITKSHLEKKVHCIGSVDHDVLLLSNIYRDAVAFITTSKSETQCLCALEAIATGLPLIGVNARAIPELIKDNGILVEPDNIEAFAKAMLFLVENPEKVAVMRQKSFELANEHSLEKSADKMVKLYESLL